MQRMEGHKTFSDSNTANYSQNPQHSQSPYHKTSSHIHHDILPIQLQPKVILQDFRLTRQLDAETPTS